MTWSIEQADVLDWAAHYTGPRFHALLSDPPYELAFGNNKWDATGVAFDPATWKALAAHLLPGAFLMVFASSVGWHRLAVALEDAGLNIHPTIFNWVRASGWPKSTKMDDPAFEGHRYGRQALKPAVEPIIVAQKPYDQVARDAVIQYGAGALNVDAGRIPIDPDDDSLKATFGGKKGQLAGGFKASEPYLYEPHPGGRYPANFSLQHDPACSASVCADTCVVKLFGEQDQAADATRFFLKADWASEVAEQLEQAVPVKYAHRPATSERDAGVGPEYARVHTGAWQGLNVGGNGKPYTGERRNNHPTVKPIALDAWLAKLLLPPVKYAPRRLLVPFAGSFTEGLGGLFAGFEEVVGVERDADFAALGRQRAAWWIDALAAASPETTNIDQVMAAGQHGELFLGRLF